MTTLTQPELSLQIVDQRDGDTTRDDIVLYGAAAVTPPWTGLQRLKFSSRMAIDHVRLTLGDHNSLNYRNYQLGGTHNRGDTAIIDSVEATILKRSPRLKVHRCNWEFFHELPINGPARILVCGSGYIFPDRAGNLPMRLVNDLRDFSNSNFALHFVGVGYNRLLDWHSQDEAISQKSKNTIKDLASIARTRTARDKITATILSDISGHEFEVIGDPALFLDPSECSGNFGAPSIGINLPFHGTEPTEWIKKNLRLVEKLLKSLQKQLGCHIVYFVHYDSELVIAKHLKYIGVVDRVVYGNTSQLMKAYATIDMHIGGMLHSCIMATAAGKPTIGLAYDSKHYGFFDLLGRSEYCIPIEPFAIDLIIELTKQLHAAMDEHKAKIKARKLQLAERYFAVLMKCIN